MHNRRLPRRATSSPSKRLQTLSGGSEAKLVHPATGAHRKRGRMVPAHARVLPVDWACAGTVRTALEISHPRAGCCGGNELVGRSRRWEAGARMMDEKDQGQIHTLPLRKAFDKTHA